MNLKASNINVDNITVKDFTADIDFSNVKVEMIGGLPTFVPDKKIKDGLEKIKERTNDLP